MHEIAGRNALASPGNPSRNFFFHEISYFITQNVSNFLYFLTFCVQKGSFRQLFDNFFQNQTVQNGPRTRKIKGF